MQSSSAALQNFDYDELGNTSFKTGAGFFSYGTSTRPHAVTAIAPATATASLPGDANNNKSYDAGDIGVLLTNTLNGAAATASTDCTRDNRTNVLDILCVNSRLAEPPTTANYSYLYDANGNLQSGAGRSLTFNRFNMPQTVTMGSQLTTFGYGPGLERLTKTVTNGAASETTLYIEGLYERRTSGATATQRYYVPAGDRLVAVAIDTGAGPADYSLHTDRLGSMDVIANSARLAVNDLRFDAWGLRTDGTAAASLLTTRGYTGHELDNDSGLVNMKARLYDPLLGRFVSADTVIPDPLDLQSLNRYSYVVNNPYRYVDPTGHIAEPLPGGWVNESQWGLTIAPGGNQVYDVATGTQYNSVQSALDAKFPGYTGTAGNCVGQECGFQANILNYNNQLGMQAQSGTPGNPVPLVEGWSPHPQQTAEFGRSTYQGAPDKGIEPVLNNPLDYAPPLRAASVIGIGIIKWGDEAKDVAKGAGELSFGANGRKLDFLFNRNIDQSNAYNALRAEGNASRIGIADTPANRAEVTRLFNEAYNSPASIVGPGKLPESNVREFFLPGVTGTGSMIQFVEQNGKVITIMAK